MLWLREIDLPCCWAGHMPNRHISENGAHGYQSPDNEAVVGQRQCSGLGKVERKEREETASHEEYIQSRHRRKVVELLNHDVKVTGTLR